MATSTQELVSKLMTDEEFRRRVESAGSPEEARSIVQEAGFQPDKAEAQQIRDQLQGQELSDEELNNVLGGSGADTTTTGTTATTAWVGGAAAAAAA
jgi:predicted ribosomally synthesized peptide with nif11-like leader